MAHPSNPLYGITIKEIARICHVDLTTARRWKRGARCPPKSALLLIRADLGCFSPEWSGWRIIGQDLISPEGWRIARGQVLIVPLMRQQLAAYETELRRAKAELVSTHEQPLPEAWPEWVFEQTA